MNIPELKKAMEEMKEYMKFALSSVHFDKEKDALQAILSVCQLLCDVSDKMVPKKDEPKEWNRIGFSEMLACNEGYNLARSEDILWLTKKMMGIEEVIIKEFHLDRIEKEIDAIIKQTPPLTASETVACESRKGEMRYRIKDLALAIKESILGKEKVRKISKLLSN